MCYEDSEYVFNGVKKRNICSELAFKHLSSCWPSVPAWKEVTWNDVPVSHWCSSVLSPKNLLRNAYSLSDLLYTTVMFFSEGHHYITVLAIPATLPVTYLFKVVSTFVFSFYQSAIRRIACTKETELPSRKSPYQVLPQPWILTSVALGKSLPLSLSTAPAIWG